MKLYNKTRCPNELLRPLLVAAGKSIGAKTGEVVVKITQGHYGRSCGMAVDCDFVYSWHLRRLKYHHTKKKWIRNHGRAIQTDGGWIRITLPGTCCYHFKRDKNGKKFITFLSQAEEFYEVAQHEWAHINDFQKDSNLPTPHTPSGRRVAWKDRPIERSAMNQVKEAKQMDQQDKHILDLAIWLEEQWLPNKKEIL